MSNEKSALQSPSFLSFFMNRIINNYINFTLKISMYFMYLITFHHELFTFFFCSGLVEGFWEVTYVYESSQFPLFETHYLILFLQTLQA